MRLDKARIALVALHGEALFREETASLADENARQLFELARLLSRATGCRARFVSLGAENAFAGEREGVEVVFIPRGLPPEEKFSRALDVLRAYAPDCVLQRGGGFDTYLAGKHARKHPETRVVFIAGGPSDVERRPGWGWRAMRRTLYWQGLQRAKMIAVENETQARLFQENFGMRARVIPSFQSTPALVPENRRQLLWAGASSEENRPELFLSLAARLPEIPCVMLCDFSGAGHNAAEAIRTRAKALPNLLLVERDAEDFPPLWYNEARLCVNTSTAEMDVSPALLAALRAGVPFMTLAADPEGVIAANGLGCVAGNDTEVLESEIRGRFGDGAWIGRAGEAAAEYVRRAHNPENILAEWTRALEAIP